jgi:hypothetical protein
MLFLLRPPWRPRPDWCQLEGAACHLRPWSGLAAPLHQEEPSTNFYTVARCPWPGPPLAQPTNNVPLLRILLPNASTCCQKVPFPPKCRPKNNETGANGLLMTPPIKSTVKGTLSLAKTGGPFCLDLRDEPHNRQKPSKSEIIRHYPFLRSKIHYPQAFSSMRVSMCGCHL